MSKTYICTHLNDFQFPIIVSMQNMPYFAAEFITFESPKVMTITACDQFGDFIVRRVYSKNTIDAFDSIEDEYCMPELWTTHSFVSLKIESLFSFVNSVESLQDSLPSLLNAVKARQIHHVLSPVRI